MSEPGLIEADAPKKKGGLAPLLIGLVGAVALGGASAFVVSTGMVAVPGVTDAPKTAAAEAAAKPAPKEEEAPKPAFVALTPISIAIMQNGAPRQLRLALMLETDETAQSEVEELTPRVVDALNTLLRAIDQDDLSEPSALDRMRAQMLRRVRLATDDAPIADVLIVEYVIL